MRSFEMPLETTTDDKAGPLYRPAAIALAACTILSLAAVAAHPTIEGGGAGRILADMVKGRAADEHVHGAVIILLVGYVFGFLGFAARVGLGRPSVLIGALAYGIGALAMIGAALNDGFITPAFSAAYANAAPEKAEVAVQVLTFAWVAIQYLSKLGFIGMAIGVAGASLPLLHARGFTRITGLLGLASGILTVGFMLFAEVWLGPQLLIVILLAQAVWNLTAAAWLIHGAGAKRASASAQPLAV